MIFAHFTTTPRRNFENSAGPSPTGSKPSAAKRWRTSGVFMIFTTSSLIRVTAAFGEPAGMKSPYQLAAS